MKDGARTFGQLKSVNHGAARQSTPDREAMPHFGGFDELSRQAAEYSPQEPETRRLVVGDEVNSIHHRIQVNLSSLMLRKCVQ